MTEEEKVYTIVFSIPKGKVTTYGRVAKRVGIKSPRVVGRLLHKNPKPDKIPCHRIVNSKGEVAKNFAFGGAKVQVGKLIREGVEIEKDRVDLGKYLWRQ